MEESVENGQGREMTMPESGQYGKEPVIQKILGEHGRDLAMQESPEGNGGKSVMCECSEGNGEESVWRESGKAQPGEESETRTGAADGFLAGIREAFGNEIFRKADIRTYSPLTLAYIGDAVYDLIIRTVVVGQANRPANDLHHLTVKYVSAPAQSKIVQALMDSLTEEELAVYRRGKNAKPHTTAKNASYSDYMRATGFEAVIGYLYLSGNMNRALELVRKGTAMLQGAM